MYSKKAFIFLITFVGFFISVFLITLLIYDPLQLYHNKIGRESFASHDRESLRFFIKNVDFDSIITGSSVSQNISAKETSENLGGKYFNISMRGANPYITKKILEYAFKRKKIKNVLYFIDINFTKLNKEGTCPPLATWLFLYDENPLNDIKIYFNKKYLNCLLKFSNSIECIGEKVNLDSPYAWYTIEPWIKPFKGFTNWIKYYNENPEPINELASINLKQKSITPCYIRKNKAKLISKYLDDNILYFIKKYPDTNFYIAMSPVPTLYWAIYKDSLPEEERIALIFLSKEAKEHKNLKIYFFDNLDNIEGIGDIGDIKLYKDFIHYEPKINSYMITSIKANKNIVTLGNVDDKYQQLIHKINNYNYEYYIKKAQECVKKNKK